MQTLHYNTIDSTDGGGWVIRALGIQRASAVIFPFGLRVIFLTRAGYGGTDPIPADKSFAAVSGAGLRAVIQVEKITQCAEMSVRSDVLYACHLEHAFPRTLTGIFATRGAPLTTRQEPIERMHKYYRFILACVRNIRRFLSFMVKAGFHLARSLSKRARVNAVFAQLMWIERMFSRLTDRHRVATPYDRSSTVFLSVIALAVTVIF